MLSGRLVSLKMVALSQVKRRLKEFTQVLTNLKHLSTLLLLVLVLTFGGHLRIVPLAWYQESLSWGLRAPGSCAFE